MSDPVLTITIKDCRVDHFRSGGPGGQNQNKRDTGTRIYHPPSGAVGESRSFRTQPENTRAAWRRMVQTTRFRVWVSVRMHEIETGMTPEQEVDEQMADTNLKVEVRGTAGWETER